MVRFSCIALFSIAPIAAAGIPAGDILLYPSGGVVKSGLISEDGTETVMNQRVFYADLGEDVPNFTEEPGWQSPDGTFPGPGNLNFQINRALRMWNGVDFSTISDSAMSLSMGPLGPATTPAFDSIVPGFLLPIGPDGGMHDHPDYELLSPASSGVYLLDLSFGVDLPGIGASQPVWILFGQEAAPEDAAAAYAWAQANVPAPATVLLPAFAVGLSRIRRQTRR